MQQYFPVGRAGRWADADPTPFGAAHPGGATPALLAGGAVAWAALLGCGQSAGMRFCAAETPGRARG